MIHCIRNHGRTIDMDENLLQGLCRRCFSNRLGESHSSEYVCFSCGLVQGSTFDHDTDWTLYRTKTYKRIFYFNERCSRWTCEEPSIDNESFSLIQQSAKDFISKEGKNFKGYTRTLINKILRSVKLTPDFKKRHQSKKFKKTLMSEKRFYDKYSEKWKTIIWRLTGKKPKLPPQKLVDLIKTLFNACQYPFELYRHAPECDRRFECEQYFLCWHNFINYDFIFRKLLQVAEIKFKWIGCYKLYSDEFPLVSKKIRDNKLRPMFLKICHYNNWPCPNDE